MFKRKKYFNALVHWGTDPRRTKALKRKKLQISEQRCGDLVGQDLYLNYI